MVKFRPIWSHWTQKIVVTWRRVVAVPGAFLEALTTGHAAVAPVTPITPHAINGTIVEGTAMELPIYMYMYTSEGSL
jgi:hypothetical protein